MYRLSDQELLKIYLIAEQIDVDIDFLKQIQNELFKREIKVQITKPTESKYEWVTY